MKESAKGRFFDKIIYKILQNCQTKCFMNLNDRFWRRQNNDSKFSIYKKSVFVKRNFITVLSPRKFENKLTQFHNQHWDTVHYQIAKLYEYFLTEEYVNKPAAQAAGADPSRCNSTTR